MFRLPNNWKLGPDIEVIGGRMKPCDTLDKFHVQIHALRLKARQLAASHKYAEALRVIDGARTFVGTLNAKEHTCRDGLTADVNITDSWVREHQREYLGVAADV